MIFSPRNVFRGLLLASAIGYCLSGYSNGQLIFVFYLLLYTLGLTYHLLFDKVRSKLFIWVFSLFIVSSAFGVFFSFNGIPKGERGAIIYLYTVQLFWILGFILIFLKMIKEHPFKFRLNKWSWVIIIILALDLLFANKIITWADSFGLSTMHILYSFAYTILKMVLLSIGLIYHIGNMNTSIRISLITAAFLFFFLSDITDVFNTLFFYENPIFGISILKSGMFCIALVFFYMYCVTPEPAGILKNEFKAYNKNVGKMA
ncbi:MAG: hypothetical protein Aureis2KO_22720 [Aureisphaera sp.]